jgi:hypothetical protein
MGFVWVELFMDLMGFARPLVLSFLKTAVHLGAAVDVPILLRRFFLVSDLNKVACICVVLAIVASGRKTQTLKNTKTVRKTHKKTRIQNTVKYN